MLTSCSASKAQHRPAQRACFNEGYFWAAATKEARRPQLLRRKYNPPRRDTEKAVKTCQEQANTTRTPRAKPYLSQVPHTSKSS